MGRTGTGVEVRPGSLRITFTLDGRSCKETVKTNGEPIPPTPANIRYATRLAAEIRQKIRHGTFSYADYFPASLTATTGHGTTVGQQLALWLGLQTAKEASTLKGYRIGASFWTAHLGDKPLRTLKHSDILGALATKPEWTGKTVNNKTSVLRLALELAVRDGLLTTNPVAGIEASPHQSPEPDPFDLDEVALILADMRARYHPQIANHFALKFYTGLRTSEALALRWDSIDFRTGHMQVSEALVLGKLKPNTKTNRARAVKLNSEALAALQAQKAHTFLAGGLVFTDPKTGKQWVDDWTPREMYWRPTLKRLGIRYRSPYQTRHTYATMMLMSGIRPAFAARQLGHTVQMFLTKYARWLDGDHDAMEMDKLETLFSPAVPQRNKAGA